MTRESGEATAGETARIKTTNDMRASELRCTLGPISCRGFATQRMVFVASMHSRAWLLNTIASRFR